MVIFVSLVPKRPHISNKFYFIRFVNSNNTRILWKLQQVTGKTVGSKLSHIVGARQSAVVGRQHSSRIGFIVAADRNSNVVDIYFLVWSLSSLLCCVGSGSNVAAALLRFRLSDTHAPFCPPPPACFSWQVTNDIIIITSYPALCPSPTAVWYVHIYLPSFKSLQPEEQYLNLAIFVTYR